ncbi:hypothetical protein Lser_V15G45399 [Lactuca serriola]
MDLLPDPLLESIFSLLKNVTREAQTTIQFKAELEQLTATLQMIGPIVNDIVKSKRGLDHSEEECNMFTNEIKKAEKLVCESSKVKWNPFKRNLYSRQLKRLNRKLGNFCPAGVVAIQIRDSTQALALENDTNVKVGHILNRMTNKRIASVGEERENYGWRVPRLPSGIVAFEEPLQKLKAAVLASTDIDDGGSSMGCDDRSVLVVAAPGGCGKTTLVKMLCHDAEIRERFGENILFVIVSETPNLMVMVSDLFNPNSSSPLLVFQSNEDARTKLENFLSRKASDPMLLVLDDVWSASFIEEIFPSKIGGHKILVTSRTAFPKYNVFWFEPLHQEDAKTLFRGSAFTRGGSRPSPTINDDLVNQMVSWCKNHPLTLTVVGLSLNGKDELAWKSVLNKLSRGRSLLDLHEDIFIALERSFEALDDEYKQCFLDFGLFREDQRIPVSSLLNMWVHLYDYDDDGVDTMATIKEFSNRNLVHLMTTGNDSGARVNHCDQQFVTQHDLLRELAIHLNSKLPLPQRSRLIINAQGDELPAYIEQVQEPMQARILSISTGESFSSKWCNLEVPNLEVLILNLRSKTYTLPHFLAGSQKLKILNITNHGLYPIEFDNFHFLGSLRNLTTIRLERVAISPSILSLENLQKVSLIMCKTGNTLKKPMNNPPNISISPSILSEKVSSILCKIGNTFKKPIINCPDIWPQLVEIDIDNCQDLVEFPWTLCHSVHLKTISITNCNEMCEFSEEFGSLTNLEMLSLRSCMKLEKLPELIWRLEKLSVLDISFCSSLSGLPVKMGGIPTIYMKGCELPESEEEFSCTCTIQ